MRGPLVVPRGLGGVVDPPRTRAEIFAACVSESVERVNRSCPGILDRVVVGTDEVPRPPAWTDGRVPLASARDGDRTTPARVVLYRRPLELRAATPTGLAILVHRTLVEQLAALTGLSVSDIDPLAEPQD